MLRKLIGVPDYSSISYPPPTLGRAQNSEFRITVVEKRATVS